MVPAGTFSGGMRMSRTQKSLAIAHSSAISTWELPAGVISLGGLK